MTDFCKVYKQYDTDNKCNTPCDTKEKLTNCYKHVALKIHPDRHLGEEKYTEIFQTAKRLYDENMVNPLANQPRQLQAQPLSNDDYDKYYYVKGLFNLAKSRENTFSDKQTFIILSCLTMMVACLNALGLIPKQNLNAIGMNGGKQKKQKGGFDWKGMILSLITVCSVAVYTTVDTTLKAANIFAGDLEKILENDSSFGKAGIIPTITNEIMQENNALTLAPTDNNVLTIANNKHNDNTLVFNLPKKVGSWESSFFNFDAVEQALDGVVDFSVNIEGIAATLDNTAKAFNDVYGKNSINVKTNSDGIKKIEIKEGLFKEFDSKFENENKEYIQNNQSLSCIKNINNCGNLVSKILNKNFLNPLMNNLYNKSNNIDKIFNTENVKEAIKNVASEWNMHYKLTLSKHLMVEINTLDIAVNDNNISKDEYKKKMKSLVPTIKKMMNLDEELSNLNEIVNTNIKKNEKGTLVNANLHESIEKIVQESNASYLHKMSRGLASRLHEFSDAVNVVLVATGEVAADTATKGPAMVITRILNNIADMSSANILSILIIFTTSSGILLGATTLSLQLAHLSWIYTVRIGGLGWLLITGQAGVQAVIDKNVERLTALTKEHGAEMGLKMYLAVTATTPQQQQQLLPQILTQLQTQSQLQSQSQSPPLTEQQLQQLQQQIQQQIQQQPQLRQPQLRQQQIEHKQEGGDNTVQLITKLNNMINNNLSVQQREQLKYTDDVAKRIINDLPKDVIDDMKKEFVPQLNEMTKVLIQQIQQLINENKNKKKILPQHLSMDEIQEYLDMKEKEHKDVQEDEQEGGKKTRRRRYINKLSIKKYKLKRRMKTKRINNKKPKSKKNLFKKH